MLVRIPVKSSTFTILSSSTKSKTLCELGAGRARKRNDADRIGFPGSQPWRFASDPMNVNKPGEERKRSHAREASTSGRRGPGDSRSFCYRLMTFVSASAGALCSGDTLNRECAIFMRIALPQTRRPSYNGKSASRHDGW